MIESQENLREHCKNEAEKTFLENFMKKNGEKRFGKAIEEELGEYDFQEGVIYNYCFLNQKFR